MKTTIIILIIVLIIALFVIIKLINKKPSTYDYHYYNIDIKNLKDSPKWLNNYDEIIVTRKTTTIYRKTYNDIECDIKFELCSYDD